MELQEIRQDLARIGKSAGKAKRICRMGRSRIRTPRNETFAIGQRVQLMRSGKGWSQEELSTVSGVPLATISNLERGRHHDIGTIALMAIGRALSVRIDFLCGET